MRKEYRDRRSATISAFRASPLASHVTFSEEGAGLHFLLRLDTNRSDEELRRLTAEAGIRLSFLSEYAAVPDPRFAHTLVDVYKRQVRGSLPMTLEPIPEVSELVTMETPVTAPSMSMPTICLLYTSRCV